ncbi:MAG: M48 family metallopeptidase [Candidatus Omnitrophota bacterium]
MLKNVILFLILSLGIFSSGCVSIYNPATGRNELYFIDEKTEISIGNNVAARIIEDNEIVQDKSLQFYIENTGNKLKKVSDRTNLEYKFYIVDDDQLNAFAVPGGHVFLNKGLIDTATKDELAFVMAHEIGHICARHSVKKMQTALGLNFLLSVALRDPNYQAVNKTINLVYNVVALGYSRKDELLADSLGVKYSKKAGFNPEASFSLLEKLKKEEGNANYTLVFLRSHPLPDERIKNIQKTLNNETVSKLNSP